MSPRYTQVVLEKACKGAGEFMNVSEFEPEGMVFWSSTFDATLSDTKAFILLHVGRCEFHCFHTLLDKKFEGKPCRFT